MQLSENEELIDVSFRFLSWLSKNFPEIKDDCLPSYYSSFGKFIREISMGIWEEVGKRDYELLVLKSAANESILDKVAWYVNNTPKYVGDNIIVGFVEAHMFKRPDSPLAKELGEMIGQDLSGLC